MLLNVKVERKLLLIWMKRYDTQAKFGLTTRRHHCRHCGRLLCSKCSAKEMPIIKYNLSKQVFIWLLTDFRIIEPLEIRFGSVMFVQIYLHLVWGLEETLSKSGFTLANCPQNLNIPESYKFPHVLKSIWLGKWPPTHCNFVSRVALLSMLISVI